MSDEMDSADLALVSRLAEGDPASLAAAYDRFGRTVYSVAWRVLGQASEAEEVVQDAFKALWDNATDLKNRRVTVVAWLITTARRRAIDGLRKRQRRIPAAASLAETDAPPDVVAPIDDATADRLLVKRERADQVRAAMRELPDEQSRIVRLAFFSGLTHHEISEQLQLPLGTVKSRLRYGLRKLQCIMEGSIDE